MQDGNFNFRDFYMQQLTIWILIIILILILKLMPILKLDYINA